MRGRDYAHKHHTSIHRRRLHLSAAQRRWRRQRYIRGYNAVARRVRSRRVQRRYRVRRHADDRFGCLRCARRRRRGGESFTCIATPLPVRYSTPQPPGCRTLWALSRAYQEDMSDSRAAECRRQQQEMREKIDHRRRARRCAAGRLRRPVQPTGPGAYGAGPAPTAPTPIGGTPQNLPVGL